MPVPPSLSHQAATLPRLPRIGRRAFESPGASCEDAPRGGWASARPASWTICRPRPAEQRQDLRLTGDASWRPTGWPGFRGRDGRSRTSPHTGPSVSWPDPAVSCPAPLHAAVHNAPEVHARRRHASVPAHSEGRGYSLLAAIESAQPSPRDESVSVSSTPLQYGPPPERSCPAWAHPSPARCWTAEPARSTTPTSPVVCARPLMAVPRWARQ